MSIKNKLIKNTIISGITKVFVIFVSFFFIPIIIKNIGAMEFGLLAYLQIFTILGFLSMAEFGLGAAVIKYVAELTVEDNRDEIFKIIFTAFLTLLLVAIIVSLLGIYFINPIINNLNIPENHILQFEEGIRLVFLTIIFILPCSIFGSVLEGLQKYQIIKALEGLFWVGYMVGGIYLSYQHVSFEKIFSLFLFLQLLQYSFFFLFIQNYYKKNFFRFKYFSLGWLNKMFKMGKFLTLMGIVGTITKSLEKLIIGLYLSPLYISYLEIILKIPNTLKNLFSWLDTAIVPITSEIQKMGRYHILKELFEKSINIKIALLYPLIVIVFFFVEDIITIWISNDYVFLSNYIRILLIWNVIMPIGNHGPKYLIGLNKSLNHLTVYTLTSNGLKLLTIIILIKSYGLLAVVLGYITLLITAPYFFRVVCRDLNVDKWGIYKRIIQVIVISILLTSFIYYINNTINLSSLGLIVCFMVLLVTSYYINAKILFHLNLLKIKAIISEIPPFKT